MALGTVQFGLDYGINNPKGQVSYEHIKAILMEAHQNGINLLDTAAMYGNSEAMLGNALQELQLSFKIVSKLPAEVTTGGVLPEVRQSLEKLQVAVLYGYLFHDFDTFKQNSALLEELVQAKKQGMVNKIGFSVYYPHQVEYLFDHHISFDLVQLPYNLLDQRFEYLFPVLKKQRIEVHNRSAFLQGLFFKDSQSLPVHFQSIESKINTLHELSQQHQIPLAALLLNFVQLQQNIDQVVIGVDAIAHLKDNLMSVDFLEKTRNIYSDLKQLKEDNEQIILPFHWK
ncbi:aldo/keto reductase [Microscilla marina ATCC 23134]|uniref:Aldo/keto reductase n=1 Tax=Microscilla marina ATCC 23134 TaxID=313606 RepID=A1ZCJ4_MICM2|nr:aldo/keto reductase [Microscilla marina ATCC 23134]